MQREIEFRGISKKTGEWVYGDLFNAASGITIIQNGGLNRTDFNFIEEETVGQYTGLKDKNKTKVFHNDFVKCGNDIVLIEYQKTEGFVFWLESAKEWYSLAYLKGYGDFEVIGNIHQNKELLK